MSDRSRRQMWVDKKRAAAARPSLGRRVLRGLKRLTLAGLGLGVVGAAVGAWFYKTDVLENPGAHISRDAILAVIAQESPVLYSDGQTRMGVFFAQEHREYVPFERIPDDWVKAIVAAEDQRYHEHFGVDIKGIARAMVQNVEAGRVVAGGSTLTQQTAKNLFYRPDRSLRSKWGELVNALRLEAHYSKSDVLEFYANQFHVSANGRGLGIAARYFFDKHVEELDTLECAFIAGLVKAPATYNPFIGATPERRDAARGRAKARTGYVLGRMRDMGALSAARYDDLITRDIPFKRGTFRYDSSVVVDEVAARLEQAPFPQLFSELGIDNPSTAGIQVVTTIDASAQREATWALWHHLTEVGPLLEEQGPSAFRLPAERAPAVAPDRPPARHEFSAAKVVAVDSSGPSLTLDLGGHKCVVGDAQISRVATVMARAKTGERWRRAGASDRDALLAALPVGAVTWASVAEPGVCDLELRPDLQGAVLLLQEGRVRAMVGGNDNRNFNRAISAQRQLGSTWKPLVYSAALQLGWSPADVLDNRENVFHFEGTWYYPRADHAGEPLVSVSWAGTRSENLASIWLLYHLLDRLEAEQFEEVAELVGLVPSAGEERTEWIRRIRDDYGIISTPARFDELAFEGARADLLRDFSGDETEELNLRSMFYGRGAEKERARVKKAGGKSKARKLAALDRNWARLKPMVEICASAARHLGELSDAGLEIAEERNRFRLFGAPPVPPEVPPVDQFDLLSVRPEGGALSLACGTAPPEGYAPVSEHLLGALADGVGIRILPSDEMWVDGVLRLSTAQELSRSAARRALVLQGADGYDFEVLRHHPDFKVLVAMRYVSGFAARLGVKTELPPVLSLPLGAVDVTLEEMATVYQGLLDGQAWHFPGSRTSPGSVPGLRSTSPVESPGSATLLISEIRDREGSVLYRAGAVPVAVADPRAGEMLSDVLRNVVRWGTGRRAQAVTLSGVPVPVGGKTGTTNAYRNAAFMGFVPVISPAGWTSSGGYTLATYVGYDDNRSMRRGGVRIAGASGALPVWIGVAQGLADSGALGALPEGGMSPELVLSDDLQALPAVDLSGLTGADDDGTGRAVVVALDADGELSRGFVPYRPTPGATPAPAPAPAAAPIEDARSSAASSDDEYSDAELEEVWLEDMGEPPGEAAPEPPDDGSDVLPRIAPGE